MEEDATWAVEDMPQDNQDDQAPLATMIDMPEVKLFGKWSLNDTEVSDISLVVRNYGMLAAVNTTSIFRTISP
jgi:hypothetical protein